MKTRATTAAAQRRFRARARRRERVTVHVLMTAKEREEMKKKALIAEITLRDWIMAKLLRED